MKLCILLVTTLLAGCSVQTPQPSANQIAVARIQYGKLYAQNLKYMTENSAQANYAKWVKERTVQCRSNPRLLMCKPAEIAPVLEVNVVNNVIVITK